ncbi:MAG TPA: NHLP bacteriocin system secretion protein [Legionellales bacterium]|nr:NHLP bacteriocin system secretion protein [Legionellales bacterium]HCA90257.1 NHLP bacteriocin system secretion protein [Legionellales bacterium]|tara:strand:+ start:171 stop:1430 length:1260 start_codon:yes stop_codon:yes gene_type:complete
MFRKQVIEHHYLPEKWQTLLRLKSPFLPLLSILMILILLGMIFFLFFGTISTRLSAPGLIIGRNSAIYSAVAQDNGQIKQFLVSLGDNVTKGQLIVRLLRPDLHHKVMLQKKQLKLLQEEQQKLELQKSKEMTMQSDHTTRQLSTLKTIMAFQKEHIAKLDNTMINRRKLAAKGVISQIMMEEQERLYNDLIKSFNENHAKILAVKGDLLKLDHQWNEHLLEIKKKILDQEVKLQQTEYEHHLATQVTSPITGIITGINSTIGLQAVKGDALVSISPLKDTYDYDALLFLSANAGQRVKQNMRVLVNPAGYQSEKYGSIIGRVVHVQPFPASKKELEGLLQNSALADKLLGDSRSVIIIRARLLHNSQAANHVQWTSSAGNDVKVGAGSLCQGQFILTKQTPFELIIPALKKGLGYHES